MVLKKDTNIISTVLDTIKLIPKVSFVLIVISLLGLHPSLLLLLLLSLIPNLEIFD